MKTLAYKYRAFILLWVAFFLQQGTRQIFGATLPQIQNTFGVSKVEIGAVATLFTLLYGICVPFAGIAADLFKRKAMIVSGVAVFCGGIFFSGLAASAGMLMIFYGILNGAGQSFYYPSATSLVGQLHKESRATAFSIMQYALYGGIIGVSAIAGYFAGRSAEGWRIPFLVFGGLGILWAAALFFALKDTAPENVAGKAEKPSVSEACKALFSKPTAICVTLALVIQIYVDVGFKTWMPAFLQENFACAPAKAALFGVLWHYLGAFAGVTIGSRIADRFVDRNHGVRLEIGIAGLAGAIPFIVYMAYAPTLTLCAAAMTLFGFFRGLYDSNLFASLFDVVKARYHASGTGLMLALAFIFGSSASTVVGWMFENFSKSFGIASLGGFFLAGALILLTARIFFLRRDYCA
ncbi:MAG: MFS transporter [Victivallaceae bacterium]|nr:MFS transporter [Victivallaceae bacterium]